MKETNIIIFCYNRPIHLKKLFNKLKKFDHRKIYIVSDGPKNLEDEHGVKMVREIVYNTHLNIFKIISFKKNIGVRKIFDLGLKWVFKFEKQIIILEDDIIPSKTFFNFCDELLYKYKDEKNISQITGCNINDKITKKLKQSYIFSKYSNIWGWATWKDRWKDYDKNFTKFRLLLDTKKFKTNFQNNKEIKFWNRYFKMHKQDKNFGTWDYAWTYTNFFKKRLSIVPKINLVKNIGFDKGTGKNPKKVSNLKINNMKLPLKHPKKIDIHNIYDVFNSRYIYSIPKLSWKLKKKILSFF